MSEFTPAVAGEAPLCTDCPLSRRDFLSAAAAAAAIAVLDGCSTLTGPNGSLAAGGPFTVKLSSFGALANVGGVARVDSGGTPTALVRTGANTFVGVSMVCTHQGTTVNIVSGGYLCPNHGAEYTTTGVWRGGQQTSSLTTFPATYDAASGTVTVNRPA